jgi:hypothetical protein
MTPDARRSVRNFFHVQLFRGGDWWGGWLGQPVLAFRRGCPKVWRDISCWNFAGKHQRIPRYWFFAAVTGPDGRIWASPSFRQFFMIGVLGGYTTFSSFSLQTLALARDGEWLFATLNATGSFVLCLLAVWAGDYFGMLLNHR